MQVDTLQAGTAVGGYRASGLVVARDASFGGADREDSSRADGTGQSDEAGGTFSTADAGPADQAGPAEHQADQEHQASHAGESGAGGTAAKGGRTGALVPDELELTVGAVPAVYMKGRLIGRGAFSRCFAFRCQVTGDTVAVKAMAKAACKTKASWRQLQREIMIHASMAHTCVRCSAQQPGVP